MILRERGKKEKYFMYNRFFSLSRGRKGKEKTGGGHFHLNLFPASLSLLSRPPATASPSLHFQHPHPSSPLHLCLLDLLLEDILERNGIGGELGNALAEFLDRHGFLVEVETEQRFVFDVGFLLQVEGRGVFRVEFLLHFVGGVVEFFEKVGL